MLKTALEFTRAAEKAISKYALPPSINESPRKKRILASWLLLVALVAFVVTPTPATACWSYQVGNTMGYWTGWFNCATGDIDCGNDTCEVDECNNGCQWGIVAYCTSVCLGYIGCGNFECIG